MKNIYSSQYFIDFNYVLNKLMQSKLHCFYCNCNMLVWYQYSHEPSQWTVERICNDKGHIKGNIEISCLSCNIRRQRMYFEKFRFTKQLVVKKLEITNQITENEINIYK